MKITRDDVLRAIEQEPLMPDSWVQNIHIDGCPVCAVGAVLREKGLENMDIGIVARRVTRGQFIPSASSLPRQLAEGNYLGALSMQFERMCEVAPKDVFIKLENALFGEYLEIHPGYVQEIVKPKLIEWVKEHLPDGVIYSDEEK